MLHIRISVMLVECPPQKKVLTSRHDHSHCRLPNLVSLTAVSGVGSSITLATCETSQVLLAGVPGGFSRGSPVFAPPTDWPIS